MRHVSPTGKAWSSEWRKAGACTHLKDPTMFYPNDANRPDPHGVLTTYCQTCPVRERCIAHALSYPEPEGIWGSTPRQRRAALATADGSVPHAVRVVLNGLG